MAIRRPTRIRTMPQPPRVPTRPPVRPSIGRTTASPEKRFDNLGHRFLRSNQSSSPTRIPRIRTGNVRNIYRPNPNVRNLI